MVEGGGEASAADHSVAPGTARTSKGAGHARAGLS